MVWCRELIMAMNRALFNMIDSKTEQLVQDRSQREEILRRHFETGLLLHSKNDPTSLISFDESELVRITSKQDAFFFWNDFNNKKRVVLFDLQSLTNSFDSLFLYTNINSPFTILGCQVINFLN